MNPARRPLIAGNWKMNAGGGDGCELAAEIAKAASKHHAVDVLVGPPFTAIAAVTHELEQAKSAVGVAAQNMHEEASGAFTGEISAVMLQDAGAKWVILGHSERRHVFGESDELIFKKLCAANAAELTAIVCVGETLDQREAGQTLEVVSEQVNAVIDELGAGGRAAVVAYEPVWAIGTGKVAKPEDAQEVHAAIRKLLADASEELAEQTRILYGGSVKPNNAEGLLSQPDIDGALVGGASLKAESFGKIIEVAAKLAAQGAEDAADAAAAEPEAEAATEEEAPADAAAEDGEGDASAADEGEGDAVEGADDAAEDADDADDDADDDDADDDDADDDDADDDGADDADDDADDADDDDDADDADDDADDADDDDDADDADDADDDDDDADADADDADADADDADADADDADADADDADADADDADDADGDDAKGDDDAGEADDDAAAGEDGGDGGAEQDAAY